MTHIPATSQIAKTFLKPQLKAFIESTLNRSVRLNSVYEYRGYERCQVTVTKDERELLKDAWSKLGNCRKSGIGNTYSAEIGDLFYEKDGDKYGVTIVNTFSNPYKRFAFEYYSVGK